jgi:hypothetical protein
LTINKNISSAMSSMSKAIENKQQYDVTLDKLIDLSMYEVCKTNTQYFINVPYFTDGTNLYFDIVYNFKVQNRVIPLLSNLSSIKVFDGKAGGTKTDKFNLIQSWVNNDGFVLRFSVTDTTEVGNMRNYGVMVGYNIVADCRGRI